MKLPSDVKFILDKFFENSYESFIVGGCVRDTLLSRPLNDYDITTNALPETTMQLFEKTIPTGLQHGTITVLLNNEPYEVTTYRIDGEYKDGRRPDDVVFVTNIKEDLARRDFTINALAYSPYFGFKDYFNGEEDLKNKIIRAVGDPHTRFNEDGLRMLRAIRFSSQLNFDIENSTFNAIKTNAHLIQKISNERINIELTKTLLSQNPSDGFIKLNETKLLENIFPELYKKYFDKDYFLGNITKLDKLNDFIASKLVFILSTCFKDISLDDFRYALKKLRFDNATISKSLSIFSNQKGYKNINSDKELKIFISLVGKDLILQLFEYLILLKPNDKLLKLQNRTIEILNSTDALSIKDLFISGSELISEFNLKPGKEIGELLSSLLLEVLENPELNNKVALLKLANNKLKIK